MKINVPDQRVGIFISGGLDSALLYHLILKEKKDVVPLLVFKNNPQYFAARQVIDYLQKLHGTTVEPILLTKRDIKSAFKEAIYLGIELMYVGVIKEMEEFLVDWDPVDFKDTQWVLGPFKDLDKSQIVNMIVEEQVSELFSLTKSCAEPVDQRCGRCNRCRERQWGFEQLGLTDPGVL